MRVVQLPPPATFSSVLYNFDSSFYFPLKPYKDLWVLYNLGAMYWRIDGKAGKALDCVRMALYHSPYDKKVRRGKPIRQNTPIFDSTFPQCLFNPRLTVAFL